MSRFETFSFLPPLSPTQVEAQMRLALTKGWVPMVEFLENPSQADVYWRQWPIQPARRAVDSTPEPLSATHLHGQLEACARRHPYASVRFAAYDPTSRNLKLCFVVRTPQEGQ